MNSGMTSVLVDFNRVDGRGFVRVARRRLPMVTLGAIEPGTWLEMADGEGNWCSGQIRDVTEKTIFVEPALQTWHEEPRVYLDEHLSPTRTTTRTGGQSTTAGPSKVAVLV